MTEYALIFIEPNILYNYNYIKYIIIDNTNMQQVSLVNY